VNITIHGERLAQIRSFINPTGVQQERMFFIRRRNLKCKERETLTNSEINQIEPKSKYIIKFIDADQEMATRCSLIAVGTMDNKYEFSVVFDINTNNTNRVIVEGARFQAMEQKYMHLIFLAPVFFFFSPGLTPGVFNY
jgi:hypothetical protein